MDHLTQRQRRRALTDRMVAALPRQSRRYTVADPDQRGLYIRVPPAGPSSFVAVARDRNGQQVWATLGSTDALDIDRARDKARGAIQRIREGLTPFEAPPEEPDAFRAVVEEWIKRHVVKNKLRTHKEIKRCLNKYVLPTWGDWLITEIRRRDIAALLDRIEDDHGARQADLVLAHIRSIANWYAGRNDDFRIPFTRAMRRIEKPDRSRILSDPELRAVWRTAERGDSFGALVRMLLLTSQRKGAVLGMRFDDVSEDGVWEIRTEDREKGNAGRIQLPAPAHTIVTSMPRLVSNPYVFAAARGNGPRKASTSLAKRDFDMRCGVSGWTLHDLRRTARSLMSRAGIRPDIAEKTLGHGVGGVQAIYDRHHFFDEKSEALAKLAALINTIVNPPKGGNVVTMAKKRA